MATWKDDRRLARYRLRRQRLKLETFIKYGSDPPECARCGFSDVRALQLDHIGGDGHRQQVLLGRAAGSALYSWLKGRGWPPGYQVLCANCNWIKRAESGEDQHGGRRRYGRWPQGPRTQADVRAAEVGAL